MGTLRFRILGSLEASCDTSLLAIGGPREQRLLAALLLDANRVVPLYQLVEFLWDGDPPATADKQVRNIISRLRGALDVGGDTRITATSTGYRITLSTDELDALVFNAEIGRADQAAAVGDSTQAADHCRAALDLWRGPLLAGMSGTAIETATRAWNERHLAAQERYGDLLLSLGRHTELLAELTQIVADHPLREKPIAQLMLALHRSARQAEALELYATTRRSLAAQLGLDPGPALQHLHHQILISDPALALPADRPTGADVPATATVPRQIPMASSRFAGRRDQLKVLDQLLNAGTGTGVMAVISAIEGTAGIGKTTLALHWAHQNQDHFTDGQLYVNLRGFAPEVQPMKPTDAIRRFLDALAVPPDRIPHDLEAQADLYRSLMADKRMLLILDNARDTEQVRPLLPGSQTCVTLVTSRNPLGGLIAAEGAHPITLDLLTAAEAHDLLTARLGPERTSADPEATAELINLCARLPLALSIAAARAAMAPSRPLAELVGELRDTSRLDALDIGDTSTDLRAVFTWSYQQLTPSAARTYRFLGLHAGPDITAPATASLTALPPEQARELLDELTNANMLTEHTPGRYTFHDLLHIYAHEQAVARDSDDNRQAAVHRILDHYLHTGAVAALLLSPHRDPLDLHAPPSGTTPETLTSKTEAMAWFESEHHVLLAVIAQSCDYGFNTHALQIPWTLADFFQWKAHWHDYIDVQTTALSAAKRLKSPGEQARAHRGLGRAFLRIGLHEDAHAQLQSALTQARQIGDLTDQAHTHTLLAWLFGRQGREDAALEHAQQALELHVKTGHRSGQADALNSVAWHHAKLGNHQQALIHCRHALELHRELGNQIGLAGTWDTLGYAHRHLGQHAQALACYQHSLRLFEELGDRYSVAVALAYVGDLHSTTGDEKAAREAWQQALTIFDDIRHPDADQVRAKLTPTSPSDS